MGKRKTRPSFFRRYGLAILIGTGLMLPLIGMGSLRAMRSNRNEVKSWLPAAYEETTTFNWYWKHFESDAFILASWDGCTLDSPELPQIATKLRAEIDAAKKSGAQFFFGRVNTGAELLQDLIDDRDITAAAALARLRGSVVGPDDRQTCLVLTIDSTATAAWEADPARGARAQREFLHAAVEHVYDTAEQYGIARDRVHLGGPPVDNVAIDVEGERMLMKLASICGILGLGLSWWSLRSWRLTTIVCTTALFSAGISLALVWCSGASMNAILLTMPALVFVAAISGAIHLANYYRDAVHKEGAAGAAGRALRDAWIPLGLATGTTAIGLFSLTISELNPIKMFGIFSGLGVVVGFGMLCSYMPAMLEIWGAPAEGKKTKKKTPAAEAHGSPSRWNAVGYAIVRHNKWVAGACLVIMAAGLYGITRVETSVQLMRMFSPSARIIQDYGWLEEQIGPLVPLEIVLRVDQKKCRLDLLEQARMVREVQQAVAGMSEVGSALAAPTFAPPIPDQAGVVRRATWNSILDRSRGTLRDYWTQDNGEELWRVSARVGALNNLDYGLFVGDLRKVVDPILESYRAAGVDGVTATYTGLVPLIYKAQHSLLDGLMFGFTGDLILIGIAIIVLMRNWSAGLLLMLPSVFPLVIVFGVMGFFGIVVDAGSVMAPAVALGVTVDDAIHFMLWCRRGQLQGLDKTESIMFAYRDCAQPIYQSWAVIGLGLSAFALSAFVPTHRFGIFMLTMLTVSSLGNLVFLPALLAGPAGRWFWRIKLLAPAPESAAGHLPEAGVQGRTRSRKPRLAEDIIPAEA